MHKDTIIEKHRVHGTDTGSSEVQIALLTSRISALTEHMNTHKKDFHSRRGLLAQVARRRSLLSYLKVNHPERHKKITEALGLKK